MGKPTNIEHKGWAIEGFHNGYFAFTGQSITGRSVTGNHNICVITDPSGELKEVICVGLEDALTYLAEISKAESWLLYNILK